MFSIPIPDARVNNGRRHAVALASGDPLAHNTCIVNATKKKPVQSSPELMAPAGGIEAGYAALHYGADAVYLGLRRFSARADAENFDLEELDRFTAYAHALKPARRVFVALNTLMLQSEVPDVIELIAGVADIGVDALIVQDLGIYRIAHRHFPKLRLHASTQMAIHNLEGAQVLRDMGFARVTLARELTLDEIREIAAGAGVETEFFAHGALCYSYSGLCLFSSMTVGRSGNRGRCAYMCRDRFRLKDGADNGSFAFSMKDLAVPDEIEALRATGLSSLKIEGRKKSPLYVGATVNYYRKLLDGALSEPERRACEADIQTIFSRAWTNLHLKNPFNPRVVDTEFVGHRGTPIGRVERVARSEGRNWLRFKTNRSLERYDGLQVDVPGMDKPFGFGIDMLRLPSGSSREKEGRIFAAPAGSVVEVLLPDDCPRIPEKATIYCSSSQDTKRRYHYTRPKPGAYRSRREVNITLTVGAHSLEASAETGSGCRALEKVDGTFSTARDAHATETAARKAFEKTGDTRFSVNHLRVANPGNLFVPVSVLNDLRRNVLSRLDEQLSGEFERRVIAVRHAATADIPEKPDGSGGPKWSVKTDRFEHLASFEAEDWQDTDDVLIAIEQMQPAAILSGLERLSAIVGRERIRISLPLIARGRDRALLVRQIQALQEAGWQRWEAANLSAWRFLDVMQADVSTDWSVYVMNSMAAQQALELGASRITLSPEDGFENMRALLGLLGPRATVIAHQDTPLFIADNCVRANLDGACPGRDRCRTEPLEMKSSHGDEVIAVDRGCQTIVIGEFAMGLGAQVPRLVEAGARSFRADFMYRAYEPDVVRKIWRNLRAGRAVPRTHVGNFDRGLL